VITGIVVVGAVLCVLIGVFGGGLLVLTQPTATALATEVIAAATEPISTVEVVVAETPAGHSDTVEETQLFEDDFSDPGSGWYRGEDAGSLTDYDHGSYRIYVDKPNMIYWATPGLYFKDVSVTVDASKVGGPEENYFGVICRYQDNSNFYILSISSDGYYSIGKYKDGEFALVGMDGMYYSDSIHQGTTTNELRADCVRNRLTLYANNTKLIQVEDSDFTSGDVGLIAAAFSSFGTNILFDDFVARQP